MSIARTPCAPPSAEAQLLRLVAGTRGAFGSELVGIYLHGSLAMGCFNPASSDIDLLVVCAGALASEIPMALLRQLLRESMQPHPIEVSVLTRAQASPWRYPTPFAFHYSDVALDV